MFIPIGDDNSRVRITPWLTWAIVAACCYVWYRQLTGGEAYTMGWSAIPYEITHGVDLIHTQEIVIEGSAEKIQHARGPQPIYVTLLSSMFMHGSWMHLIGNMIYMLVFADQIEARLRRFRFLIFYVVCGLAAAMAQILSRPDSIIPILGASGAIAGVLGAYLVTTPRNPVLLLIFIWVITVPAWLVLGGWFALQLLALRGMDPSAVSGVAYMAHIGGFIAGAILVHALTPRRRAGN